MKYKNNLIFLCCTLAGLLVFSSAKITEMFNRFFSQDAYAMEDSNEASLKIQSAVQLTSNPTTFIKGLKQLESLSESGISGASLQLGYIYFSGIHINNDPTQPLIIEKNYDKTNYYFQKVKGLYRNTAQIMMAINMATNNQNKPDALQEATKIFLDVEQSLIRQSEELKFSTSNISTHQTEIFLIHQQDFALLYGNAKKLGIQLLNTPKVIQ